MKTGGVFLLVGGGVESEHKAILDLMGGSKRLSGVI